VRRHFPKAEIEYVPDQVRNKICDSWPEDVDDTRARRDWGWKPYWDVERAFEEYLLPTIVKRYEAR
jgi:nucleoside-diphosphate-sugar epimerase